MVIIWILYGYYMDIIWLIVGINGGFHSHGDNEIVESMVIMGIFGGFHSHGDNPIDGLVQGTSI